MPLNPNGYPLDLTGLTPSNLITDEVHLFNEPSERLFVPGGGPFYHIGLSIRNSANNQLLLPNTDYKLLHLHKPAARESGKDVYAVVFIINQNIPGIIMDYRVVGGIHGETASVIRTLLESFPLPNNGNNVSWGQLIGVPTQFTPAEHLHHIDEIYNFNDVVSVLEQLRIAILAGDGPAINAIYQYFHQYLTNADYVTRDELLSITSIAPFFEIKSFPDYATLRNATTMINGAPGIYCCLGRDNMFDGNGRIFLWDIDSTLPHNGDTVVRPHVIVNDSLNGRFISFQRVEKDLNLLAVSLQRSINFNGTIEDGIIQNGHVVVGGCDNYLRNGTYWVGDANTIANAPFSWCVMNVDNIVVAADSNYGEVIQTFYNGNGDKCTRIRYFDVGVNGFIWSAMRFYARREGDEYINFHVENAVNPKHAVNLQQLQNYGGNADVNFNVKDATEPDHAVTLRQLINDETECNLGIVIRYYGNISLVMPCYVGEQNISSNIVNVYISNALRSVNIADITPLYIDSSEDTINYFNNDFGHVFLVRNPNDGSYRLIGTPTEPEYYLSGNLSNKRKRLRMWSNSGSVNKEDTVYLGAVYKETGRWSICRSWFQDPGMIEHTGLYNSDKDDITALPKISGPVAKINFDDTNYCQYGSMSRLYSPFYSKPISTIKMICWGGEKVNISLDGVVAVDHPTAGIRGVTFRIYLDRLAGDNVGYAGILRRDIPVLSYREPNAKNTGVFQHIGVNDNLVLKETGVYELSLSGESAQADTKGYLIGSYNGAITATTLSLTLDQIHAYRNLFLYVVNPNTETRTITLSSDLDNFDIYQSYVATYGPISNTPFLTDIFVNIGNNAVIGSSTTSAGSIFIDNVIPAGIKVTIFLASGCYIVGKGGKGGDNSGGSAVRDGEDGGDAIRAERPFTIYVQGGVLGGGGGGGGSGAYATSGATGSDGGPGGGGAGRQIGLAGSRHRTSPIGGDETAAGPASDGTLTTGGIGGETYVGGPRNENTSQGSHGGAGGGLGQPGGSAYGGFAHGENNYTPGDAGRAVRMYNGAAATVINQGGQIYGAY